MILFIVSIFLFLLIAGFVFLPVSIVADSNRQRYYISIPVYLKGVISKANEEWKFRIRIFMIPFTMRNLKRKKNIKQQTEESGKSKRKMPKMEKVTKVLVQLYRSFRIKKLEANIDTGDFPLNAQLIPVVSRLNNKNIDIGINFHDTNTVYLRAETYLYKLIWIMIRYIIF
jgi:hypothetical protein